MIESPARMTMLPEAITSAKISTLSLPGGPSIASIVQFVAVMSEKIWISPPVAVIRPSRVTPVRTHMSTGCRPRWA